jgi:FKBP-type peptidyl-prolyl cis-trans isomerase 2
MGEEEKTVEAAKAEEAPKRKRAPRKKPAVEAAPVPEQAPENVKTEARPAGLGVSRELIIGAVIIVAVIAVLAFMGGGAPATQNPLATTTTLRNAVPANPDVAEADDIVTVEYTGSYENGTVFDSSVKEVAEANGIYNPLRTYEPITFTLGYGGIIKGFEEAVEGMRIGQEKDISLPPEKAYGYPKPGLIQSIERLQKSPLTQNVSRDKFVQDIGKEPYAGMRFSLENRTEFELTWPMDVLAVTNDTVTFRYSPEGNTTIDTVFGKADVYGTDTDIVIRINPTAGQRIVTLSGPARVTDVNGENVTLDFNPELAGKTLKFKLKLMGVVKQK